jgi:V8-like Glu-specific endopeptidase
MRARQTEELANSNDAAIFIGDSGNPLTRVQYEVMDVTQLQYEVLHNIKQLRFRVYLVPRVVRVIRLDYAPPLD